MIIPIVSLGLIFTAFSFRTPTCTKEDKVFVDHDGFTINWTEYSAVKSPRATRSTAGPTVFIMPPTGGETPIERAYATALCARNQKVLVLKTWTGSDEEAIDFDLHNRTFGRGNRALTIMAEREPGPLRILGTSLGGLYATSILQTSTRFERAVLIVAGWPFSQIISDSDNSGMKMLREKRSKEFGLKTKKAYGDKLNEVFKWDKSELIDDIAKRTEVLMIVGTDDDQVPTATQLGLASHIKPKRIVKFDNGHVGSIAKSFFLHSQDVLDFLSAD